MNAENIIATMALIGSDLPAYRQLLDQVIGLFEPSDQDKLKTSYADAVAASDKAHAAAQAL